MEFQLKSGDLAAQKTACLVLGVYEKRKLPPLAAAIDKKSDGYLTKVLRRGDLTPESGQVLLLPEVPALRAERVLLVACGKRKEYDRAAYRKALAGALSFLQPSGAAEALFALPTLIPESLDLATGLRDAVQLAEAQSYRYTATKKDNKAPKRPLKRLQCWLAEEKQLADAQTAVQQGQAIAQGIAWTKDLANLPGNVCTPTYLAEQALALQKEFPNLRVEILEEDQMKELGMGALLSVARGSRQPPKLIVLDYSGAKGKPVVLVGKGLTFDAGGISLKPANAMDEMKYDMSGAAAVLGTLRAALTMRLPLHLMGVIPSCENLPDGNANKPGDVVTSLSGQTIEVLNTDAEGRLILCDALTYCERFDPELVVDIATLTGACVVALGEQLAGLFTQDENLAQALLQAGEKAEDPAWRMPLWAPYQRQLDSPFADVANIGGKYGGAITAACFLARFTKQYPWAHLDIAGVAWKTGKEKGATGRPVGLLSQFLLDRCN